MARPGFYFCICPDPALAKQRVAALLAEHPPSRGNYERKVFWGDDGLDEAFWQALTLNDLFGTSRVLLVRNAQNLDKGHWALLSKALARVSAQAWPVFCLEGEFDRGKPKLPAALTATKFFAFARDKGWLWQSPGLGEQGVRKGLQDWAKARGLRFAPGVLDSLSASIPADATGLANELEKLELAMGEGREVTPDLAEMVASRPEMDIFSFLDALQQQQGAGKVWQKVLQQQLSGKGMLFQFLGMLQREARILWQLLHRESGVRLPGPVAQRKERLAQQLGGQGIARIWDLAMAADARVKTGEAGEEQSLEMLVADLFVLFGNTPPPRGGGRPQPARVRV